MFLQHVGDTGLLVPTPEKTGTLAHFKVDSRRRMCHMVLGDLDEAPNKRAMWSTFQSAPHVAWVMEVIGAALSLPIDSRDDLEAMRHAVNVYEGWLGLEHEANSPRPDCLAGDTTQRFTQSIFDHLSLVFHDRNRDKVLQPHLLTSHIRLCRRVLDMIMAYVSKFGSAILPETWERLLCLLVGIADYLLRPEEGKSELGDIISYQLLRVLLSTWMRSGTRNGDLWQTLETRTRSWVHRLSVVKQYNALNLGLTWRVVNVLWPREGKRHVVVRWADASPETFAIDGAQVLYTWHRVYQCVGSPADLTVAEVHSEYLLGLSELVDCFLEVAGTVVRPVRASRGAVKSTLPDHLHPTLASHASSSSDGSAGRAARGGGGSAISHQRSRSHSTSVRRSTSPATGAGAGAGAGAGGGGDAGTTEAVHQRSANLIRAASRRRVNVASGASIVQDEFRRLHSMARRPSAHAVTDDLPDVSSSSLNPLFKHRSGSLPRAEDPVDEALTDAGVPPPPPSLNEVLEVYGPALFSAAFHDGEGFEYGRSTALGSLGRIFTARRSAHTPVYTAHLTRFYLALRRGLQSSVPRVLVAIMCNCSNLLSVNHKGVRALVPDFVAVLPNLMSIARRSQDGMYGGLPVTLLNNACVIMLSSMLCLPNNFEPPAKVGLFFTSQTQHTVGRGVDKSEAQEAAVPEQPDAEKAALAELGANLRGFINNLLKDALPLERDECSLQMILWALCTKVLEDADMSPGVAHITVSVIVQNLARQFENAVTWPASVMHVALRVLATFACIGPRIHRSANNTIPHMVQRLASFALTGVSFLQGSGEPRLKQLAPADVDQLAGDALSTILDFCVAMPLVLTLDSCAESVLSLTLAAMRDTRSNRALPCPFTKACAERLLSHLLSHVGRVGLEYLPPWGMNAIAQESTVAGLASAFPVLAPAPSPRAARTAVDVEGELAKRARFFVVNGDTLVTLIEVYIPGGDETPAAVADSARNAQHPAPDEHGGVVVILRNANGRFMWVARSGRTHYHRSLPVWDRPVPVTEAGVWPTFTEALRGNSVPNPFGPVPSLGDAAASSAAGAGAASPAGAPPDPLVRLLHACGDTLAQHDFADAVAGATSHSVVYDGTAAIESGARAGAGAGGAPTLPQRRAAPPAPPAASTPASATAPAVPASGSGGAGAGSGGAGDVLTRLIVDTPPHSDERVASFGGIATLMAMQEGDEQSCGEVASAGQSEAPCSEPMQPPPCPNPYRHSHLVQSVRRVFADLGLLPLANAGSVLSLSQSPALFQDLCNLDATPCTMRHEILVHYLSHDQMPDGSDKLFICEGGNHPRAVADADFRSFLTAMGWWVDLDKHTGYNGGLNTDTFSGKLLYCANIDMEAAILVPSLNLKPSAALLAKHASEDGAEAAMRAKLSSITAPCPVQVIWNRTHNQYVPGSVMWNAYKLPVGDMQIIIDPQPECLYRVHVFCGDRLNSLGTAVLGPLMDGMVVGRRLLGRLVRLTALSAWQALLQQDARHVCVAATPTIARSHRIKTLIAHHRSMQPPGDVLLSLATSAFSTAPAATSEKGDAEGGGG